MKISYKKHILHFKRAAATSRSILHENVVYFLIIEENGSIGVGECNPLNGLSLDDREDYEDVLITYIRKFENEQKVQLSLLEELPSIKFGFESALLDLKNGGRKILFESDFTKGKEAIAINGLLWMGSKEYMLEQLAEKLRTGFTCIKMKIGAIDFHEELSILAEIRKHYSASEIEIRVDANGAFKADEALSKLDLLSEYSIHSIEQPMAPGQFEAMSRLARLTPIPIALDEELIPIRSREQRSEVLRIIKPQYIILKPSLLGGFEDCNEWIELAERGGINWWVTSALESNIGLNAIAQYTFSKVNKRPQGLGTGSLYSNNIESPLYIENGFLKFDPNQEWGMI